MKILKLWLITSFVIFVAVSASYMGAQQVLRQSANDPQIQMAEDAQLAMKSGKQYKGFNLLQENVDISKSLSPFLIFYTGNEGDDVHAIGGNVAFEQRPNETEFDLPKGVFDRVRNHGEDIITWQAQNGARIAAVIVQAQDKNSFVLVGRNLREVEKRIQNLTVQFVIGFVGAVILDFIVILILERLLPEKRK